MIKQIDDYAFQNVNLTDIYYDGTATDWSRIYIGINNDCLFSATKHFASEEENDKNTSVLAEYDFQTVAGRNSYGEIYFPHFETKSSVFAQVYSRIYTGKYALMDLATGELLLDNIDDVGMLSEYSDLIWLTTNNNQKSMIYNLDTKSVCCELLDTYGLGYYRHFSEYGGFVTLASDNKLHFISNEGVVGNAVAINQNFYSEQYQHLITWAYLGEGLYQLGVGNSAGLTQTIGVVNTQGKVVAYTDSINQFINGLAIVKVDGKYGVINKNGDCVIAFEYDDIKYMYTMGRYEASKGDVYYEFNTSGDVLNSFSPNLELYDGANRYLGNGMAIVYRKASNYWDWKYNIVNSSNEFILPVFYTEIYAYDGFSEGLCKVGISEKYMGETVYGYIDASGNIAIPFEYDYAGSFSEGLAAVEKNDKYGYIDKSGKLVIPYEYDYAGSFSEGVAKVYKEEKDYYINKNGEVVNKEGESVSENADTPVYSLTDNYVDYLEDEYYTGGIKINATGQIIDISELKILPIIVGKNGEYIIAFSSDFEKWYKLNIEYLNSAAVSISSFNVSYVGNTAKLNISVSGDVSSDSVIYAASYNSDGKLLELQKLTLNNGSAGAIFSTTGVYKYRAFVWDNNMRPLAESGEFVPKVEITAFTSTNYGANAFINLSAVNVPTDATVYAASYNSDGKLLELQKLTLNNGSANAVFSTADVLKYRAFVWNSNLKPLAAAKECTLQ